MSPTRYHPVTMVWTQSEEVYLHTIQTACEELSNAYLETYRRLRNIQARIKIPIIIVGSFTGITSFGTETFPQSVQKWVSAGVGVVTICIAIVNSIESYFKIGENANAAINTTNALQQLREDINKELSLPEDDRQAPGLTLLRDCYTRYQQIMSQAPTLNDGNVFYVKALAATKLDSVIKRNEAKYALINATNANINEENSQTTDAHSNASYVTDSLKASLEDKASKKRTLFTDVDIHNMDVMISSHLKNNMTNLKSYQKIKSEDASPEVKTPASIPTRINSGEIPISIPDAKDATSSFAIYMPQEASPDPGEVLDINDIRKHVVNKDIKASNLKSFAVDDMNEDNN